MEIKQAEKCFVDRREMIKPCLREIHRSLLIIWDWGDPPIAINHLGLTLRPPMKRDSPITINHLGLTLW